MSRRQPKASYWQEAPTPRNQLVLIPSALESLIPADHPVRLVDEILDQMDWTQWEAAYHGSFGKPPIHPSILAKTLLFSMIRRIRSSRQIEYNLKHSIDFLWLTSGRNIDHTTLCKFRRKHTSELRGLFKQMIRFAIDLKLANIGEICIDGTRVLANANKYKTCTTARLTRALEEQDRQIDEAFENFEVNDSLDEDLLGQDISADRLPAGIADLKARRDQLAAYLETTQAMDATRKKNGTKGPAQLPKADPDSRILPSKEGGYAANFTPMATTETGLGMIVVSEVVIGNVEHDQFTQVSDTIKSDYGQDVDRAMADAAFTRGENLVAAEERGIELIGPLAETKCKDNPALREDLTQPVATELIDKLPIQSRTNCFDKTAFVYNEAEDCYYCPAGKPLPHRITYSIGQPIQRTAYTCQACAGCELSAQCVRKSDKSGNRELIDDVHEPARRRHRKKMQTDVAKQAYNRRLHFGETPFAVIKASFDMRRFLLRGIEGVRQEWRWASTAFNLKKLMSVWETVRLLLEQNHKTAVV